MKILSFFKKNSKEIAVHFIIWVSLYLIGIFFIRNMGIFSRSDNTLFLPLTFGTLINVAIFYIVSLWLVPRLALQKKTYIFIFGLFLVYACFTVFETLIDYIYLEWVYSSVDEPFLGQLVVNGLVHFVVVSIALGYGLTRSWVVNENRKQVLNKEKLTAEVNFLKTQLNPHFLFNVLNMAYSSACQSGDERTADIVEKLSGLMRYMIYDSNVPTIEMEREIEYIENYIKLQKMRFSDDIPVKIDLQVKGNPAKFRIVPLILICFIENAFKYGVKLEQDSRILISLEFKNSELEFVISNTIFPNTNVVDEKQSGIGLKNTRKRLEILYPDKHKLVINDQNGVFLVKLRLKTM
jgi:two-component system, LytTR family, sensor kinase